MKSMFIVFPVQQVKNKEWDEENSFFLPFWL